MYTVTIIHEDGATNVQRTYASLWEAEVNFDWYTVSVPLAFKGDYKPFVALALHAATDPQAARFHNYTV